MFKTEIIYYWNIKISIVSKHIDHLKNSITVYIIGINCYTLKCISMLTRGNLDLLYYVLNITKKYVSQINMLDDIRCFVYKLQADSARKHRFLSTRRSLSNCVLKLSIITNYINTYKRVSNDIYKT